MRQRLARPARFKQLERQQQMRFGNIRRGLGPEQTEFQQAPAVADRRSELHRAFDDADVAGFGRQVEIDFGRLFEVAALGAQFAGNRLEKLFGGEIPVFDGCRRRGLDRSLRGWLRGTRFRHASPGFRGAGRQQQNDAGRQTGAQHRNSHRKSRTKEAV